VRSTTRPENFLSAIQPRHAIKSQVLADFIVEWTPPPSAHGGLDPDSDPTPEDPRGLVFTKPH
jgi:ribonuclease HI